MKKLMNILTLAMMAFVMTSLTSCDDDEYIARTLEGTWEGNMYSSVEWNGLYYDASYSQVCFLRDPYTYSSGTGYWVDYYEKSYWGGYNYVPSHIEFTVRNGAIHIYFVEDDMSISIYDYNLSDDYFTGYIEFVDYYGYTQRKKFKLYHVSSPNWSSYRYWGYDSYYDYYYSNKSALTFSDDENAIAPKKDEEVAAKAPKRVFRERNDK